MISNVKIIFIFIFSFFLLSCMGGGSGFDSSTKEDTSTQNRNAVNPNPQNSEALQNNSRSITERFNDIYNFFTKDIVTIMLDTSKTAKEKRDILKEFKGKVDGALPEYEVMKRGVEIFKESTEARKAELKCDEDIADRRESEQIECDQIAEDLEEVEKQESYYEKIDCYVEKTNKFKATIDQTLRATSDSVPAYMISIAFANAANLNFRITTISLDTFSEITQCETDDDDDNNS